MQIDRIDERVEVLAAFRATRVEPLVFKWNGKDYRITKINLIHTQHDGRERVQYYSISGEGAAYRLAYRPLAGSWILEEVWTD